MNLVSPTIVPQEGGGVLSLLFDSLSTWLNIRYIKVVTLHLALFFPQEILSSFTWCRIISFILLKDSYTGLAVEQWIVSEKLDADQC